MYNLESEQEKEIATTSKTSDFNKNEKLIID